MQLGYNKPIATLILAEKATLICLFGALFNKPIHLKIVFTDPQPPFTNPILFSKPLSLHSFHNKMIFQDQRAPPIVLKSIVQSVGGVFS